MTTLDQLPPRDDKGRIRAIIESPRGSRAKLKYEPHLGIMVLDRSLPVGLEFPFDYGFIPSTRGQDGDPLDLLVLIDAPVAPGCAVPVRLIGVIEAEQADEPGKWFRNDRLIAVAEGEGSTTHAGISDLDDLEPAVLDQVELWFSTYNTLRGRQFRPQARRGAATAVKLVEASLTGSRRRPASRPARRARGLRRESQPSRRERQLHQLEVAGPGRG